MFEFIEKLVSYIFYGVLGLDSSSRIVQALEFFAYNLIKVYLLILIIGFLMGIIRSFITPEKTKLVLKKYGAGIGNLISSLLAIITPVESLSTIPIFVGLLESGVPPSVAFTYLFTAPITNELAFAVFWALFGYKVAFGYYATGIIIGLLGGIVMGFVKTDSYLTSYTREKINGNVSKSLNQTKSSSIISEAIVDTLSFFISFWLYVLIGVALASIINGYVPKEILIRYVGFNNPFAVPMAVFIVIFFYINVAMALPIIMILIDYGFPLGTIFAFTMAVTATSLPELLIIRRSLKPRLIAIYMIVLLSFIIGAGYFINLITMTDNIKNLPAVEAERL